MTGLVSRPRFADARPQDPVAEHFTTWTYEGKTAFTAACPSCGGDCTWWAHLWTHPVTQSTARATHVDYGIDCGCVVAGRWPPPPGGGDASEAAQVGYAA